MCVWWGFQARNEGYTVGDFMTGRQHLHVVKPSTSVDDGKVMLKMIRTVPSDNFFNNSLILVFVAIFLEF